MTIADTIPHYELMITDNNIDEFVLIMALLNKSNFC